MPFNQVQDKLSETSSISPSALVPVDASVTQTCSTVKESIGEITELWSHGKKYDAPDPSHIAGKKYTPWAERIALHMSNSDESYAALFSEVVKMTENGANPLPIGALPKELQEDVAWMFAKHGLNLDIGGELIHRRTGIRLVLDKTGQIDLVWAWTQFENREGEPIVRTTMF